MDGSTLPPPRNRRDDCQPYRVVPSGCHIWLRSLDQDGYGYYKYRGKSYKAHRYYYERAKGPIPDGFDIDHTCRRRNCVNPDHLEAVPHVVNVRRGRRCKITLEVARAVRQAYAAGGVRQWQLAERFDISPALVAHILTNRFWREDEPAPSLPSPSARPSDPVEPGACPRKERT